MSVNESISPNLAELQQLVGRLNAILQDPHPGLITWHEQYERARNELLAFYDVLSVYNGDK